VSDRRKDSLIVRIASKLQRTLATPPKPLPERAENPYLTHLPILIGLARIISVRRVLEFGAGEYSTPTFLNRAAFPDVSFVRSCENDAQWLDRVEQLTRADPHIEMTYVEGPISTIASRLDYAGFDLVFIDDSLKVPARAMTIEAVAQHRTPDTIVVIHDYEVPAYQRASQPFRSRFQFTAFNPTCGVVWNDAKLSKRKLVGLQRIIADHAASLRLDDIAGWSLLFDQSGIGSHTQWKRG
jgi:predicted O-methyltransferase YrrM